MVSFASGRGGEAFRCFGARLSVLGHSSTSRRAPRNGSHRSKKKELAKARQSVNSFVLMLGLRVSADTRRLRNEEVAFKAQQKDMAAMRNRPLRCLSKFVSQTQDDTQVDSRNPLRIVGSWLRRESIADRKPSRSMLRRSSIGRWRRKKRNFNEPGIFGKRAGHDFFCTVRRHESHSRLQLIVVASLPRSVRDNPVVSLSAALSIASRRAQVRGRAERTIRSHRARVCPTTCSERGRSRSEGHWRASRCLPVAQLCRCICGVSGKVECHTSRSFRGQHAFR